MRNTRKIWNNRGLASLMTVTGFIIMSFSGVIAYIVPQGRIAYWTDWHLFGLTKTNWGDIHILSSLLFLIAGGFHIYFNWKPLKNYFISRARGGLNLRKEIVLCLIVGIWVVASSILGLPPLSYVLDFNEYVKASWIVSKDYEPPFGHAELLSLPALCRKVGIPVKEALNELKNRGVRVESAKESLAEIAQRNNLKPMKVYSFINHLEPKLVSPGEAAGMTPEMVEEKFAGTGTGRKTIDELVAQMNLDLSRIRQRLAKMKIELAPKETLKQAASRSSITPIELLKSILVESYEPKKVTE
ncbi:DUF4405 domain-containing protein [Thermodesulfobacteriota bacterium]